MMLVIIVVPSRFRLFFSERLLCQGSLVQIITIGAPALRLLLTKQQVYSIDKQLTTWRRVALIGNEHKTIHAVKSVFDAILMTIMYPHTLWIASGGSEGLGCSLTDSSILKALSGRKVVLHPQFGAYYGAKFLEEILLKHGIQADTDAFLEYTDYEGKKNRDTIGRYVLLQLQADVSIDDIKASLNIEA